MKRGEESEFVPFSTKNTKILLELVAREKWFEFFKEINIPTAELWGIQCVM
ncbi:MAG: hypothetical protein ABH950_04395 [Candidatus Altiarchaeota archaeon]